MSANLISAGTEGDIRQYNPAAHHAKLAVNTAFSLCEFVLASYHYQQQKQSKRSTA
jgi:hypothetical protein